MDISIISVGCSQPGHLAPERTPVIEATFDIRVQNIFVLPSEIVEEGSNRIMGIASRSEARAVGFQLGFPLWFESLFG